MTSDGGSAATYREAVLADDPLAYVRFGEASGTVAHDETTHHNDITVGGSVTWGAPGALASDPDTAIRLDGSTSNLSFGSSLDFAGTSPFSLEAWVSEDIIDSEYRFVFGKDTSLPMAPTREEFGINLQASGGINFERYVGGGWKGVKVAALAKGTFVHIVGTYDGATMLLYVDGAKRGSVPDARSQATKNVPFYVGSDGPSVASAMGGVLDEIAIYDHVLTPARVGEHFNAAKRTP